MLRRDFLKAAAATAVLTPSCRSWYRSRSTATRPVQAKETPVEPMLSEIVERYLGTE